MCACMYTAECACGGCAHCFSNTLYSVFSSGRRCPDVPKTRCLQAAIMTSLQSCELWLAFSLASGRHQPVSTDETGPIIVSLTAKVNKTGKDQRLQRCGLKGTVRKTQDLECVNSLKRTLPGIKVWPEWKMEAVSGAFTCSEIRPPTLPLTSSPRSRRWADDG